MPKDLTIKSSNAIAKFKAFCPPNVGKIQSGFSLIINSLTISIDSKKARPWFINVNDGTIEGIEYLNEKLLLY